MYSPYYLQDRLNAMILTPAEVEDFKAQRTYYARNYVVELAQGKLEAVREASVAMLKAAFMAQEYEMPKIEERVLIHHFGFAAKG